MVGLRRMPAARTEPWQRVRLVLGRDWKCAGRQESCGEGHQTQEFTATWPFQVQPEPGEGGRGDWRHGEGPGVGDQCPGGKTGDREPSKQELSCHQNGEGPGTGAAKAEAGASNPQSTRKLQVPVDLPLQPGAASSAFGRSSGVGSEAHLDTAGRQAQSWLLSAFCLTSSEARSWAPQGQLPEMRSVSRGCDSLILKGLHLSEA